MRKNISFMQVLFTLMVKLVEDKRDREYERERDRERESRREKTEQNIKNRRQDLDTQKDGG